MTRTCLDVLTDLQESLANALELTAPVADETDAHFLIRNQLDQRLVVYTRGEYTVSPAACAARALCPATARNTGTDGIRTTSAVGVVWVF